MVSEEELKREYNLVEGFESYQPITEEGKRRLKNFEEFYNKNKEYFGKKILDLACGGGIFSNFLASIGHYVVGVDILDDMLNIAKKYAPSKENPKYIKANILNFVPEENLILQCL